MRKKERKNAVCTEFGRCETGFTLVSSLLRLLIIIITLPMLILMYSKFTVKPYEERLSIQQLFFILQNEVYLAKEVTHGNNLLRFTVNHDHITFERYGRLLRRRVNDEGHEIYLRNIDSFLLERSSNGIKITITMMTGEAYERILITNE